MPPSIWVDDPDSGVRDYTERCTNAGRMVGPDDRELKWFEQWGKNVDTRKVIMDVLKGRLELDWPQNYKALIILGKMPEGELEGLEEKLGKLADSAQTVEGFKHIKELAKPLHEKAKAGLAKKEEEEMKKKQAAIQAMWGGLWANDGYTAPALQYGGWKGWPYPYDAPPGIARAAAAQWPGKPPDGWIPTAITALPQIHPFSRTAYYAIRPEAPDTPKPPSNWTVYVGIGPNP
ncbi:hypothetical protein I302_108932 [Kwoniella bestiolae CBS 10118]|uniref:Uncharacterized protein n=1 Tax=Kwoniella bestiolae CBS 10118 TaxID=1296100 RepID=A0A1B9FUI2_9TREE|nr:hypothetical protein I302_08073 [Kwoniella bestiolae CBS 10118]OCF22425.1 hypothetical protein I302_08073 [Kwoniella bestiolae CBS 10118]